MSEADIIYALSIALIAYWVYRLYSAYSKKETKTKDDYKDIINSEKYKVKGKFEN